MSGGQSPLRREDLEGADLFEHEDNLDGNVSLEFEDSSMMENNNSTEMHVEGLIKQMDQLEQENQALRSRNNALEHNGFALEGKVAVLDSNLEEADKHMEQLTKQLSRSERKKNRLQRSNESIKSRLKSALEGGNEGRSTVKAITGRMTKQVSPQRQKKMKSSTKYHMDHVQGRRGSVGMVIRQRLQDDISTLKVKAKEEREEIDRLKSMIEPEIISQLLDRLQRNDASIESLIRENASMKRQINSDMKERSDTNTTQSFDNKSSPTPKRLGNKSFEGTATDSSRPTTIKGGSKRLNDGNLSVHSHTIVSLSDENVELRKQLNAMKDKVGELLEQGKNDIKVIADYRSKVKRLDFLLAEATTELRTVKRQAQQDVEDLRKKNLDQEELFRSKVHEKDDALAKDQKEVIELRAAKVIQEREIDNYKEQTLNLRKLLIQTESKLKDSSVQKMNSRIQVNSKVEKLTAELNEMRVENETNKVKLGVYEKQVETLTSELKKSQKDTDTLRQTSFRTKAELESLTQDQAILKVSQEKFQGRITGLTKQNIELKSALDQALENKSSLETSLRVSERQISKLKNETDAMVRLQQAKEENSWTAASQLSEALSAQNDLQLEVQSLRQQLSNQEQKYDRLCELYKRAQSEVSSLKVQGDELSCMFLEQQQKLDAMDKDQISLHSRTRDLSTSLS
eukprot:g1791.t1